MEEKIKIVQAVIACGSNLEDPNKQLENAQKNLSGFKGIRLLKVSPFYKTKPVDYEKQPDFLNGAFLIETTLSPEKLLRRMQDVERLQGRARDIPKGPRTLDLDLIFYGDTVISREDFQVPHSSAHEREFVLRPVSDIAPEWVHPIFRKSVKELLLELS